MTDSVAVFSPADRITANNISVPGAKVKFYLAGTSTPKSVYSDAALTVSLGTVVYTDSDGYPVTASGGTSKTQVYIDTAAYKVVFSDAADVVLWTFDNVKGAAFNSTLGLSFSTVASAATTDLGSVTSNFITVSGTTTITTFLGVNQRRTLKFLGALTLTYNATSLVLPGAANITTVAGDVAEFVSDASQNWTCVNYQRASGLPVSNVFSAQNHAVTTLASAATVDLGTAATDRVNISGTTTITSFGTAADRSRLVKFLGALTLTHNATTLVLPGAANITTVAGDFANLNSDGSGNWTCVEYIRSSLNLINPNGTVAIQVSNAGSVSTPSTFTANVIQGTTQVQATSSFVIAGSADNSWTSASGLFARLAADNTTASAANVFVSSTTPWQMLRSTSSVVYKTDIEPLAHSSVAAILSAKPIWYRSIAKADNPNWSWVGFLAEDVAEIEPRLVHWGYDEDDYLVIETPPGPDDGEDAKPKTERVLKEGAVQKPDGVQYERFVVPLALLAQDHERRIDALEGGGPTAAPPKAIDLTDILARLAAAEAKAEALQRQVDGHSQTFKALGEIDLAKPA